MLGIEISLDTVQLVTFRYGGSKNVDSINITTFNEARNINIHWYMSNLFVYSINQLTYYK